MSNYSNAYAEVYTILNVLDRNDYKKIPTEVIKAIDTNRNKQYIYKINETLDLTKQKMMKETKAILYNLFRDYLCTTEQRDKIIKWQKQERQKNELKKSQKYNPNDLFKNKNTITEPTIPKSNQISIIVYKESIFTKINNWFKGLLRK